MVCLVDARGYTGPGWMYLLQSSAARSTGTWLFVVEASKRAREKMFSGLCGVRVLISYCVCCVTCVLCEVDPSFCRIRREPFIMASLERERKKVKRHYSSVTLVVSLCPSSRGSLIMCCRSCKDQSVSVACAPGGHHYEVLSISSPTSSFLLHSS